MKTVWEAMSDITRRKILTLLRSENLTAGEISSYFDSRPATISHHLSILKDSGLVKAERNATVITYSLDVETFKTMIEKLESFVVNAKRK